MLYVSTRNRTDSYTAHRALHENRAPDGGMYVPFQLPQFSKEEILQLKESSFGDNFARILNIFFSARLTGWDVEFCCGRYPVKSVSLPHRLIVAEAWHNTASGYQYVEHALYSKLCGNAPSEQTSDWARIAIRIALMFAIYGTSTAAGNADVLDFAVDGDGFVAPIATWYARRMGLPVGMIICGSHDSSTVWDLLHRGELNTAAVSDYTGLERLIYSVFGYDEAMRFVLACQKRRVYHLEEDQLNLLNEGMFAAVVSSNRVPSVISSFYRSQGYILDLSAAISFGALQDYRSRIGESNATVVISLNSPTKTSDKLSAMLGISAADIDRSVNGRRG